MALPGFSMKLGFPKRNLETCLFGETFGGIVEKNSCSREHSGKLKGRKMLFTQIPHVLALSCRKLK